MLFDRKELSYLLKMVRDKLGEMGLGLHRYFLNRNVKSKSEEELLPELKEETRLLTSIRNKLWRLKRDQDETNPPNKPKS